MRSVESAWLSQTDGDYAPATDLSQGQAAETWLLQCSVREGQRHASPPRAGWLSRNRNSRGFVRRSKPPALRSDGGLPVELWVECTLEQCQIRPQFRLARPALLPRCL